MQFSKMKLKRIGTVFQATLHPEGNLSIAETWYPGVAYREEETGIVLIERDQTYYVLRPDRPTNIGSGRRARSKPAGRRFQPT
jgi:hypothetical protein